MCVACIITCFVYLCNSRGKNIHLIANKIFASEKCQISDIDKNCREQPVIHLFKGMNGYILRQCWRTGFCTLSGVGFGAKNIHVYSMVYAFLEDVIPVDMEEIKC